VTAVGRFTTFAEQRTGRRFADRDQLWRWSVDDLDQFWSAVWDFHDVRASVPYARVLSSREMPGTRWFEGARLSYAEHALRRTGDQPAVIARSQTRGPVDLSWNDLRDEVARARTGLLELGVRPGDRVAAYLPNIPETVVAFLAAASIGAVFSSCAPEFGVRAVLDRLQQIEPKVLLAVGGYRYGGRDVDRRSEVEKIRAGLPSLTATVIVPYLQSEIPAGTMAWDDLLASAGELAFEQLAPDHPLYELYSSGTTGLPKAIVHGQGGILLEHFKAIGLHGDLGPDDRFFWFTTTGWMMWNYLVSGLLLGSAIVLFDGDPTADSLRATWRLAEETGVTSFGTSAPFLLACRKAGLVPASEFDLSRIRAVGSTGAPLPAEGFRWVYDAVAPDALLSSVSGGTDVCTPFVGGSPDVPVWQGEISCRYLGVAAEAFDADGRPVVGTQGELVVTEPMPSMPIGFSGDDGSRYRASYFETFPGVWRHGDWVTFTDRGSCVITGRSDATLNRGGVRFGTSELYRVVESDDSVADSLVVHLEDREGGAGVLVLFLELSDDVAETDVEAVKHGVCASLRTGLSPRHVPDEVHIVGAIPTTLSGKKLEVPVKRILAGARADEVASAGALRDPSALAQIEAIAATRRI
jgi:acetoacetyl-CoA synthetase